MGQEALNLGIYCLRSSSPPTVSTQSGDITYQNNKVNSQVKIGCTNNQFITNHHNYFPGPPPTRESSFEYNEQGELIPPQSMRLKPDSQTTSSSSSEEGRAMSPPRNFLQLENLPDSRTTSSSSEEGRAKSPPRNMDKFVQRKKSNKIWDGKNGKSTINNKMEPSYWLANMQDNEMVNNVPKKTIKTKMGPSDWLDNTQNNEMVNNVPKKGKKTIKTKMTPSYWLANMQNNEM
eukprot:Pgem_evm1s438